MVSVEDERTFLKNEQVLDHLGKLVDRVISEKPKDAFALVEVISRLVKNALPSPAVQTCGAVAKAATPEEEDAVTQYVKKTRQLDAVPRDEGGEVVAVSGMTDFVEEAEILSWAGVGFAELESYKIMCSMRNLAKKEADASISKLRFWGKILGTGADYFVAEAMCPEGESPEGEEDFEAPGTPGVNQYTYYVTTDLAGDWQRLPHIKPREIVASRLIKRLFSGDTMSKVITHPFYDGTEAVVLRAQIARINADTALCIKGFLKRDEEGEPTDPPAENAEFTKEVPPPPELLKPASWTHMQPHILKHGRTTHKEIPEADGENDAEVAKMKEEQDADPSKDLIRGLVGDKLTWTIKQTGDPTVYANPSHSTCVSCVRSLTWPGAVCVARGARFVNFYVGYGLQAGEPDFFPPAPPDVQDEPADDGEQLQPPGTEEEEAVATEE